MTDARPRVTIVTVNYNMRDGLEKTIRSVISQTYRNLEYIIVDGASRDGSVDVIRRYESRITKWTSEPDKNLYDAMNKGARSATGEWLLFMNSGDCFVDDEVVEDIFREPVENSDIIYGHVLWRYDRQNFSQTVRAASPETLPQRMFCSHQSLFARTQILRQHPFDLDLLISDYDFLVNCLSLGKRFSLVDRTVAAITKGGRSDIARFLVLRQQQGVLAKHGLLTFGARAKYPFIVTYSKIFFLLREMLPQRWVRWMLSRKMSLR
jgi:glycosyltransferase involved in cell wall biosynthesis